MNDSRLYVSCCLVVFSVACGSVKPEGMAGSNSGGQSGSSSQSSGAGGSSGGSAINMAGGGTAPGSSSSAAPTGASLMQSGGSAGGMPSHVNAAMNGENAGAASGGSAQAGGSAGSGTVPDSDAMCKQACNKLLGANCGDLIADDCATCVFKDAPCQHEIDAVQACTVERGKATCRGETSVTEGCDAEQQAVDVCRACEARPDDPPCWTCTITSCCAEQQAFVAAQDYELYDGCMRNCDSSTCYDGCSSAFPLAAAAYRKVDACRQASCTSTCAP